MAKDDTYELLKNATSRTTKINQIEVDKAIESMFKGIHGFLTTDAKRVKIPYFGSFRLKKNLKAKDDNG